MIKEKLETFKNKHCEHQFSNTKKIILASMGVLMCLFIIFAIYKVNNDKSLEVDESLGILFDTDRPIVIKKDDMYGYILKDGEILLEPEFLSASPFWNGYAAVSKKENEFEIIDKDGRQIIKAMSSQEPEYYKECGVWLIDNKLYDKDLKVIFDDDSRLEYVSQGFFTYMKNDKKESGIVDKKGEKVFTWESDYITVSISESFKELDDHYALVSDYEAREEVVSLKTGKTIYKIEDVTSKYLRQEKNNIFRIINRSESYKTEKWLYLKDSKIVYETVDEIYSLELVSIAPDIIKIDYGQNYKDIKRKSRYDYYDVDSQKYVEEPSLHDMELEKFRIGFTYGVYTENKKFGLKIGESVAIESMYDKIDFLEYDLHKYLYEFENTEYVLLENDDKTLFYDIRKNKVIREFPSTSYSKYKDSSFLTFTIYESNGYTKKGYLIYNVLTGQSLELDKTDEFKVDTNFIFVVTIDNEQSYYNIELKKVYEK